MTAFQLISIIASTGAVAGFIIGISKAYSKGIHELEDKRKERGIINPEKKSKTPQHA